MTTKQYLIKIIWCVILFFSVAACSTSDDIYDEDYVPTEEDIAEILKKVNTEWGKSAHPTNPVGS